MSKHKVPARRNPVAHAPIMRKGGAHIVSRSGQRSKEKLKIKKLVRNIKAGHSGLDAVWPWYFLRFLRTPS